MKILIVTGGRSSERKISLISAAAVKETLQKNGHEVTLFDFKKGYTALKKTITGFDVVFPVMHGKEGEDGTLYQFLHAAKKSYIGSDPKGAKIAFDKILFKKYCDKQGLPTADWKVIKNKKDISSFGFPCVLKAASGGSSHEVALLRSNKDLENPKVEKILKLDDSFFVEKMIEGVEITVAVLLGKALPIIQIIPPESGWFDYKNKYSGKTKEIPFAPSVNKKIQKNAQEMAVNIHRSLGLGSYSRTDMIVQGGTAYILEVNTPGGVGLTGQSLLPKAAKAAGISFGKLLEKMLEGRSK